MSLWWRDEIAMQLTPRGAELTRLAGWPRRGELGRHSVAVQDAGSDWRAALDAASERLGALAWRNARLNVVLSEHFVRYVTVPWVERLSEDDARAFASERIDALYGGGIEDWTVCLTGPVRAAPRIAAAVPRGLIDALRSEARRSGLRLNSVRPLLADTLARRHGDIGVRAGWLVQSEPGRVSLARFAEGLWQNVRSVRKRDEDSTGLLALIEQDALAAGLAREHATVFLGSVGNDWSDAPPLLREHGWTVRILAGGAA